jgi:hypothetical protein
MRQKEGRMKERKRQTNKKAKETRFRNGGGCCAK